ncbi:MAG TPA: hypothetical protein VFN90_01375 [Gemmatimonadales bacterium]|nr:hypothetical protein [Gemmatimonadales bacterium]
MSDDPHGAPASLAPDQRTASRSPDARTMAELAGVFDRVRDHWDWKGRIDAVIPAASQGIVAEAIWWFTETEAVFEPVPRTPGRLRVTADGYRRGPYGDPHDLGSPRPRAAPPGATWSPQRRSYTTAADPSSTHERS